MPLRQLLHGGHEHTTTDGSDDSAVLGLKIGSIFIISVFTFTGVMVPLRVKKLSEHKGLMSYANTLAGAILLGFGMLHMLPDAVDDFAPYLDNVKGFPIVYAVVLWSFFIILLVEKSILNNIQNRQSQKPVDLPEIDDNEFKLQGLPVADGSDTYPSGLDSDSCCNTTHALKTSGEVTSKSYLQPANHAECGGFHSHNVPIDGRGLFSPYLLTAGLAFHSIFEGLAVGLQTTMSGLILLLIGICLHKFAEAFAMGMSFMNSKLSFKRAILLVCVFAAVCPVGIIIGISIGESLSDKARDITGAILNAVAVGVFLYISILGMIVEEFAKGDDLLKKVGLSLVGCLAMGCLSFFE